MTLLLKGSIICCCPFLQSTAAGCATKLARTRSWQPSGSSGRHRCVCVCVYVRAHCNAQPWPALARRAGVCLGSCAAAVQQAAVASAKLVHALHAAVPWRCLQGLISPRAATPKPVPWSQAGTTSCSSPCAAAMPAPVPLQQSQHSSSHKRVEPDLREQIARHLAATGSLHAVPPAAADALTSTAAAGEHPVAATTASSANNPTSSSSTGSSKGSQQDSPRGRSGKRSSIDARSPSPRKAGPSRTQLKAVRKLFPISAPSLKPAAALQARQARC